MDEEAQAPAPKKKRAKSKKGKGKKKRGGGGAGLNWQGVKAGTAARFPVSYCTPELRRAIDRAAAAAGLSSAAYVMQVIERAVR